MELATVMSVVQTILTAFQTLEQLKDTFSFPDCKRKLADLERTVNTIKSVLQEANAKQDALNSQERMYIDELKDVIYDADDILDEFVTLVKRKKLTADNVKSSNKVMSFFSRFNINALSLSNKVEQVNRKLETIASNSSKFLFKIDNKVTRFTKEETCSFLSNDDKIIGREKDVDRIIEMLFDSNAVDQPNVSSLAIVGMGGLGKTALAQLVYNDPRVTSAFQLKCWTCIADQDQEQWSLSSLLGKVLRELAANNNTHDLTSLERMQCEVEKQLRGVKYLFVLDDVWTESYDRWLGFEKFLKVGQSGSRIIVTTRSRKTAQMIGGQVHELQGLSEEESWLLFERMAFLPEQIETPDRKLVKLGKEIVKKCTDVPLAIRVVGSLLRGQSMSKWELFQEKGLANISENDAMNHILKLSYYQLDSSLKNCFVYSAIFPKDFGIYKQKLIRLWMAQGYINKEYEGEEYFLILLQRCFFQDVSVDDTGEIERFKIHDLLHDIARQVAGKEIWRLNSDHLNVDKKVRHLALLDGLCPQGTFNKTYIRTCVQVREVIRFKTRLNLSSSNELLASNSIGNWICLRSLDLSYLDVLRLPESIGELLHLRCLDLSWSQNLRVLPNSITKLVNLQTLILYGCERLKELPEYIYKLVDLTILDMSLCYNLSHMHSNLGMLTNLHTLGQFVVGGASTYKKQCFDGLEVLRSLNNLKGSLEISIRVNKNANYAKEDHGGEAYLMSKEHLSKIFIEFKHEDTSWGHTRTENIAWEQSLLEDMQPHFDIKHLHLQGYNGETMPRWASREDNSALFYFPNLVDLEITNCGKFSLLPSLENLPHLKTLRLWELSSVEYVLNVNLDTLSLCEGSSFFPCLEHLSFIKLPKLKGWWQGCRDGEQNEPFPCFPKLKALDIYECAKLKSIPISSSLKSVLVSNPQQYVERDNTDLHRHKYKSLLPSDAFKCRFMTITDFERVTFRDRPDPNPTV